MKKILIATMISLCSMGVQAQMTELSDSTLDNSYAQGILIDPGTLDAGYLKNNPQLQDLNRMIHDLIQWDTKKTGELLDQQVNITQDGIVTVTTQYYAKEILLSNFTLGADKSP